MSKKIDDIAQVIDSVKMMIEENYKVKCYIYAFPLSMSRQKFPPRIWKLSQ